MPSAGFVHLHVHSAYSLLKGSIKIAKLAELAKKDHQPALALTDTDNMFGALEFSDKMAGSGIQPIVGCEIAIDFGDQDPSARNALLPSRVVLLAAQERGYRSLMRLNSRAFLETPDTHASHIKFDWLEGETEGLIVLTGGPDGPISLALAAGQAEIAALRCERLAGLFGDRLYVELQRHNTEKERRVESSLIDIAYAKGLPLVATNEPYFAATDDYEAHDALLCIAGGRLIAETEREQLTPDHRFKTRAEMAVLFADIPEALASTVEIAERCSFRPMTRKPILPFFTVGAAASSDAAAVEAAELKRQAEEGLGNRLQVHGLSPGTTDEDYKKRLAFELDVIMRMKYAGYFLIVADFIKWAKGQGIPVGPGRGSGAGSLVAWALTITDLDPIKFGLLFERFLNPERVSMPDFDIDFCQDRRGEVIKYVQERYGRDQVAQIITFGTLQARGVLRDVGRVLQMPYGQVDKLTKLVPQNPAAPVTLAAAIESEPKLQAFRDEDPVVARAFDIAQRLEGLTRHASTHAAGIVIGDRPLSELVPMYRDPKSDMPVTQFNMKWVEPAGLVKFDFLGLKTLTVLDVAIKLLNPRDIHVDLATLPIDDAESYQMLARGEVVGVFQVESQGMRRALVDMRPDRFEDIIALVALYRPGPMANIPTYCLRKHGDEEPEYLHPVLEPILKETFGVIIYQEQVMQIAQVMSGYSLGDADLLRRAMGKKIRAEMEKQREIFVAGAVKNGVPKAQADTIFELLAKFAVRLRLQQEPRGGLCAGVLPHRLHEGALPGGVHRGVDDARSQQHRQAFRIPLGGAAPRHQGRAAEHQSLRRDLRGRRQDDLLRARRAEGRRHCRCRADHRGADEEGTVHLARRFRRAGQSARDQQARHRKSCRGRRLRHAGAEPGARLRRCGRDPRRLPARASGRDDRPERHVRQLGRCADRHAAADRAMVAGRAAAPRI
ncbi:DNA polymerase-3 subunit alpha [Bradyrhizobium sp. LM4.3]